MTGAKFITSSTAARTLCLTHCKAAVHEDECAPLVSAEGDGKGSLKKQVIVLSGHQYTSVTPRQLVAQSIVLDVPT
jgi:hypothetical protein